VLGCSIRLNHIFGDACAKMEDGSIVSNVFFDQDQLVFRVKGVNVQSLFPPNAQQLLKKPFPLDSAAMRPFMKASVTVYV